MDGIERAQFDHIGVVTEEQRDGEVFVDATRVWVTSPRDHPFHVEYLRFEPDTTVTGPVRDEPHVAYRVADVHSAIEGHGCCSGRSPSATASVTSPSSASAVRSWSSCSTRTPMRKGGFSAMRNALAGHTNSFHTYGREEALAGIAEAGYRTVELTAVEGWTEHVDLDADTGELRARLEHYGLEPVVSRATPT